MSTGNGGANPPTGTLDEANEAGYLGSVADQTPNENYTVEGVTSGAETPETTPPDGGDAKATSSSSKSSSSKSSSSS